MEFSMMDLITSWAGSPEVRLVSETGLEVKVHRILLGLYTDQWRYNLQGVESSEVVFLLHGVGHQELQQLVNDIYKPLYATEDSQDNILEEEIHLEPIENFKQSLELGVIEESTALDDQDEDHSIVRIVSEEKEIFTASQSKNELFEDDETENEHVQEIKSEEIEIAVVINKDKINEEHDENTDKSMEDDEKIKEEIEEESKNSIGIMSHPEFRYKIKDLKYIEKIKKVKYGNRTMLFCKMCDFHSKTHFYIRSHIESKHFGLKYPCEECEKVLPSLRSYQIHKAENHSLKPIIMMNCDYCEYSAPKKITLDKHISSVHLNEKVECPQCLIKIRKDSLKKHLVVVHGPKTILCPSCSKYVSDIKYHRLRQCGERKCPVCEKTFYGQRKYFAHLKKVHKDDKVKKEKTVFSCSSCDYTTHGKYLLQKHDQVNHSINYLYCDQCDYKTKLKIYLSEHQKKKHDSSFQKFKCDQCDYQCTRSDYLKKHIQSLHEKVRYQCDQCEYQATRKQYLNKHIETIHKY